MGFMDAYYKRREEESERNSTTHSEWYQGYLDNVDKNSPIEAQQQKVKQRISSTVKTDLSDDERWQLKAYQWQNRYKDKTYDEIQRIIGGRERRGFGDDDETDWLRQYAYSKDYNSVDEYDMAINRLKAMKESAADNNPFTTISTAGKRAFGLDSYSLDGTKTKKDYQDQIDVLEQNKNRFQRESRIGDWMSASESEDFAKYKANRDFGNPSTEDVVNSNNRGFYTVIPGGTEFYDSEGNIRPTSELFDYIKSNTLQIPDKLGMYDSLVKSGDDKKWENGELGQNAGTDDTVSQVIEEGRYNRWDLLKDNERDIYYYYLNKGDKESAYKFLDDMAYELGERANEQQIKELESAGKLETIAYNIASAPAQVFGGVLAFGEDAYRTVTGQDINPYSPAKSGINFALNVRKETAQRLKEDFGNGTFGEVVANTYQAFMSGVDSVIGGKTLGSLYTVTMGLGAASQRAAEMYQNGASREQVALGALTSGAIEWLTERFSFDAAIEALQSKPFVVALLAGAANEGVEEVNADLLNYLADDIIMKANSTSEEDVRRLMTEQGMSEEDARKQVLKDNITDTAWSFYGGLISGGMMTGGAAALGTADNVVKNRAIYNQALEQAGAAIRENENVGALSAFAEKSGSEKVKKAAKGIGTTDAANMSKRQEAKVNRKVGKAFAETENVAVEGIMTAKPNALREVIKTELANEGITAETESKIDTLASGIMHSTFEGTGKTTAYEKKLIEKYRTVAEKVQDNLLVENKGKVDEGIIREQRRAAEKLSFTESLVRPEDAPRAVDEDNISLSDDGQTHVLTEDGELGDTVDIVGIADNNDGVLKLKLSDGSVRTLAEVSLASEDEAVLYGSIERMRMSPVAAEAVVSAWNGGIEGIKLNSFLNGIEDAYRYGKIGVEGLLDNVKSNSALPDKMLENFYRLGEQDQAQTIAKDVEAQKALSGGKAKASGEVSFGGRVIDRSNVDEVFAEGGVKLKTRQKATVKMILELSDALGVDIEFFESELVDGERKGESGSYKNGKIKLDLYAGTTGKDLILFTAAHELTHFFAQNDKQGYHEFAKFLIDTYQKKGVDIDYLVAKQQDKARRSDKNARELSYDEALEELVADSCETMLRDSDLMNKVASLAKQNLSLAEKISVELDNLVKAVKGMYKRYEPESEEGRILLQMQRELERIRDMWASGVMRAGANYKAAGGRLVNKKLAAAGISIDSETGDAHFSVRYTPGKNNVPYKESIAKLVAEATGRSYDEALKWVNAELSIANIILGKPEFLDFDPDTRYDFIKKNSDYPQGTVDPNNLCRKREEFTVMFDMLQKMYPNKTFTALDVADMRHMLDEEGMTVACGACFVEDRRQLLGEIADTYIGMWKKSAESGRPVMKMNAAGAEKTMTVTAKLSQAYGLPKGMAFNAAADNYIPNQYDLTTYEGFKQLEKNHPMVAYGFIAYNNSRGQQAARLIEGRAEYTRQILDWSPAKVEKVNNEGGLRIFSFSDFEAVSMLDIIQVIIDCSAKGVKIQGYTKVPEFAKLVRNTGIKLNRSLMPKGKTGIKIVNGKEVLDYDTKEGIDINDKDFLDESDNPDIGNILVGINAKQIGLAFLDDFVDYIIPFHTNKSKAVCQALGLDGWENYKESQHEKDIATEKASKHNVNIYTQVIDRYNPTNKVEFVDAFLKECRRQKKIPRYAQFLNKEYSANGAYSDGKGRFNYTYREGYHKLLIDFKMFDRQGNILLQGNVTPDLDNSMTEWIDANGKKHRSPHIAAILEREIDRRENYTFPQKVFDRIQEKYGESGRMLSDRSSLPAEAEAPESESGMDFDADQMKLVPKMLSDRVSAKDSDGIRYSDRVTDPADNKTLRYLENENAKLREDVADLKELLSLQGKVTHGSIMKKSSILSVSRKIMKEFVLKGDASRLAKLLSVPYQYITDGGDVVWEEIVDRLKPALKWVLEHQKQAKNVRTDYANDVLGYLHGIRIKLSNTQKSEAAHIYGSYNNFRRKMMGKVLFTNNGTSLDSFWGEFNELYPGLFPEDTNEGDQLRVLVDVIDSMRESHEYIPALEDVYTEHEILQTLYDGYWDVVNLHTVADKNARKTALLKSKHKEQMDALREQRDAKIKDLKEQQREKIAQVKADAKERQEKALNDLREKYRESREKAVEKHSRTEYRNRIKKVVKELNDYLLHGTKEKNVPLGLQGAVADALSLLNMDTVQAERLLNGYTDENGKFHKGYNQRIAEETDPLMKQALIDTAARLQRSDYRMQEKLANLKAEYDKIKSDPDVGYAFDENVSQKIGFAMEWVGNTPLNDMTLHQLEEVYDAYKMILTTIKQANKMFKAAKYATIEEYGMNTIDEVRRIGGSHDSQMVLTKFIKKYGWQSLKPIYAMRMIGSDTFTGLFYNLLTAQGDWYTDMVEAKDFRDKQVKAFNFKEWDFDKEYSFTAKSGKEFPMTLEQIMSLYAYSRREQALDHLVKGGIVFDSNIEVTKKKLGIPLKYTTNTANAYNLSKETISEIISKLTPEQKTYVETMQEYLSDVMGAKGNETSVALYGIKLYKEKNYFPLKSAKQYMFEQNDVAGEVKIKNSGFSKETMPHASNPVILSNFSDVWANHVNDMAMYHTFVLPLEDFNRVYNFKKRIDGVNPEDISVNSTLQNAYGDGVTDYIKNMIIDLNGGARGSTGMEFVDKMLGKFKKGAVFASASVMIQQPSAVGRAMTYISPKYFAKTTPHQFNIKQHSADWSELKRYAPVAGIKEMGYFDTGVGQSSVDWLNTDDPEGFREKMGAFFSVKDSAYRDDVLFKAPELADEITWCHIWNAVKAETAATTNLAVGSKEFLERAGKRFTEVIELTQVYDSVLSRSGLMRSKDSVVKMATAFMSEPTVSMNMMLDGITQARRIGGKKGLKFLSMVTGGVAGSILLNSMLKSLVMGWRDDEDEDYYVRYFNSLKDDLIDSVNPLTYFPFVNDVVSIIQGYDVSRMDMDLFTDLVNAVKALKSEKKSTYEKVTEIIGTLSAFLGVPFKNVERDLRPLIKMFYDDTQYRSLTDEINRGYRAFTKGDADKAKEYVNKYIDEKMTKKKAEEMSKDDKDRKTDKELEKDIKGDVKGGLTERFKKEYVEAYKAKDNDKMAMIRKYMYATGLFDSVGDVIDKVNEWLKER